MRNPHAGQPFTSSDTEIAAALEDVSIPALMLSCVHMTADDAGRRAILDGPIRPAGIFLNEVQGYMSEEDKAAARTIALDVIRDYRDRGCPGTRTGGRLPAQDDDGLAGRLGGARGVCADDARGDGARRPRLPRYRVAVRSGGTRGVSRSS